MRDCGKGPGLFYRGKATHDVNDILGNLRLQKIAAGACNSGMRLPGSRRMFVRDEESGIFGINPTLEPISALSGF
jgi:hypothetical protein